MRSASDEDALPLVYINIVVRQVVVDRAILEALIRHAALLAPIVDVLPVLSGNAKKIAMFAEVEDR